MVQKTLQECGGGGTLSSAKGSSQYKFVFAINALLLIKNNKNKWASAVLDR